VLAALGGCDGVPYPMIDQPIPRNKVSDFFAKDFELPPYKPREEALARARHRVKPNQAFAALGDGAAAFAGGQAEAWHASAAAAIGDMSGAATGEAVSHATDVDPLPHDYSTLELPIPIIATDPNSGVTVGVMPVSVFREGDRITNIFAPQITWNQIDGYGALFRMRRFFTDDSMLSIDAGSTSNGAEDYDLQYKQNHFGPWDILLFNGRVRYITELSDRFYGLGSDSKVADESSYTFRRAEANVGLGFQLPFSTRIEFAELLSTSSVGPGRVSGLPSSIDEFRDVKGMLDRVDLLGHKLTLTLDTRDRPEATTDGVLFEGYYEIGDATLASNVSFQKAGVSFSGVESYLDGILATAGRVSARWTSGKNVPFYDQTSIGGKTTLRGFGDGRFVGKNGFVAGIEERWNVWQFRLKDTDLVLQVAGFGEMGRIFGGGDPITVTTIQFDAGGAVRLIIPGSDKVVSLDVGVSKEGVETFLDLGYPF
jgi:hypothetical protein